MRHLRIYCDNGCREAWRDDLRHGLTAGLDAYTDADVRDRLCLYCGQYVPTHAERRAVRMVTV